MVGMAAFIGPSDVQFNRFRFHEDRMPAFLDLG
jgi:hypothetical protein